jgi:Family of unknown function (DUF6356)
MQNQEMIVPRVAGTMETEDQLMPNRLKDAFLAHPEALNETYGQHFGHAMSYAGRLFAASFCAFAHALLPFLFERTASNAIRTMYGEMTARSAARPVENPAGVLPAGVLPAGVLPAE